MYPQRIEMQRIVEQMVLFQIFIDVALSMRHYKKAHVTLYEEILVVLMQYIIGYVDF
jgi:hypothetical protein